MDNPWMFFLEKYVFFYSKNAQSSVCYDLELLIVFN